MKCRLINKEINENYGIELLKERGVKEIDKYLHPTEDCIQSPEALDNVHNGINLIVSSVMENKKILIVVDSDVDGFTSAAIIYLYLKDMYEDTISIDYLLHEGKQHGLQDHINNILEENQQYGLIILPDSSSNDKNYHDQLKDIKIPCLVLDHHLTDEAISSNAVIINNQLSQKYQNKELTGAGVVWQFCRYYDWFSGEHYADKYTDLAALGIIGDMGSVLELENRAIIEKGLNNINNFCFKTFCEKQDFSMGGKINPITVAFYIVPLMNAMIRVGTMEEKKRLFEAFLDGSQKIPSQKRGAKGELEFLAVESARECTNARTRQNKIKDAVVEALDIKIHKHELLDNKILFVRLDEDDDFPAVLNGLVAMQLSQKFKRPTIVARLNDEGYIRGSARGLNESELSDFKSFLTDSNLFEYNLGHANAFGTSIKNSDLEKFHKYSNEKLKDIDFGENVYDINFERQANSKDLKNLILDLSRYDYLWGQQNNEPYIYIQNINIKKSDVQVMGKNLDTVKFEKNGIIYIKFHAKQLIEDLKQFNDMQIEVVGRANLNEWGGQEIPQLFIENYSIKNGEFEF